MLNSAAFGVPQMLSNVCCPGLEAVAKAADAAAADRQQGHLPPSLGERLHHSAGVAGAHEHLERRQRTIADAGVLQIS